MPPMQQVEETSSQVDSSRLDYHHLLDGSLIDESFSRAPGPDSDSFVSIADLLGLNTPRGSLVGGGQNSHGQVENIRPTPPLFMASPTRPFSGDDSGYQTSLPGSPLPLDMSSPGKSTAAVRRGRLDSGGTFPPPSPSASSQGPFSPNNAGGSSRAYRSGSQTISESGSTLQHPFMNSRSNSPDSDISLGSLDNNLSDLMNRLYLHARTRSDSGMSTGLPNSCDDHRDYRQQELSNLSNLNALQNLNNPSSNYYHQNQPLQCQSPLGSPLSSPLASPDKAWSPGSLNSMSSSVPGSPLHMSSPLRVPAPSSPPSPGSSPLTRMNSSLSSSITRFNRNVGSSSQCEALCTWSGQLPQRTLDNPTFSVKVFLGGVPWDINDAMLAHAFKPFGPGSIRVEWPVSKQQGVPPPKGYVYIIFETEKQVKALLQACSHDFSNGGGNWYFKISSKRMKAKEVQVIPWVTSDTNWVRSPSQKLDPEKTVFVGGLHGMLNAFGLAKIMNDLFDGVVYAGIDTDKHKYPIGSARITFNNSRSFFKAVNARFIEIKSDKFSKKVQCEPYIEDSPCSLCSVQHGPYFCREISCFRYFCRSCWYWRHSQDNTLMSHTALMRTSKSHSQISCSPDFGMGINTPLQSSWASRRERMLRLSVDGY